MKISIITVCYNSGKYIRSAIESTLSQTYSNIEYIIIDGCSSDNTMDIVKSYEGKISVIISEPDHGIYAAINKGIKIAKGDIVGILHADDIFASDHTLQHIMDVFLSHSSSTYDNKKVDVVYGNLVFTDQRDLKKVVRCWVSRPFKPQLLKKGWMPPHPTVFMRRSVYEKHGLFNTALKCSADYDYILRVFSDNTLHFHYLPEVITRMRMGGISTGGIRQLINKKLEDYWVLKNNNIPFPLWTLFAKSFSKISQLIFKK